jgi:predicted nucleotidyltransferase
MGEQLGGRLVASLKPVVRWWLAATSFPPFIWLYRAVYELLVRLAVIRFKAFPGTRAIYLRRGFASGDLVAGLTDIDLTVIGEFDAEEEERFMESYRRLARFLPLFDPTEIAETPARLRRRYQISPHFQFRFSEGRHNWRLLFGRDYVRELPPLSPEKALGGCVMEIKVWWSRFARVAFCSERLHSDKVFTNSACYKAVAEILRVEGILGGQALSYSRKQALEDAQQRHNGRAALFLNKLRRSAAGRHLRYDGAIVEDTAQFLLRYLPGLCDRLKRLPGWQPAGEATFRVDCPPEEALRTEAEEALVREIVAQAREQWGAVYRAAYVVPSLAFAMDDILLLLETGPDRLPSAEQLRSLCRLVCQKQGSCPRRRVTIFLLLPPAAFQIHVVDLDRAWEAILAPATNPGVFLALAQPWARVDGAAGRQHPRVCWTQPLADFLAEERLLFTEALENPAIYKANTLDFLRMFWKHLQLVAVGASARTGEVVFPLTLPAVLRALERLGFMPAPFLPLFERAYRSELKGSPADIDRFIPAAVSYLKQVTHGG